MKLIVIDGNSIINRVFYGIKLLTASDGHFTNALFGFMNVLVSLSENYKPDGIAVAFDVKEPTFRHKMYDEYKAGRKPMPAELFEQFEPLKELLRLYGCHIIECPGFEADDILGTLSSNTGKDDFCYIVTGDRDSLQLIKENVSVLLTSTKMGRTQTVEYTPGLLMEEYGVTPSQMIELKALQGDSSDNIPGVAGIGPKTAGELIKKYSSVENIYSRLDSLEVSAGVREKLRNGYDSCMLSRTLGTICLNAPIDTDLSHYILNKPDNAGLYKALSKHEMFKLISKLGLKPSAADEETDAVCGIEADSITARPFVKGCLAGTTGEIYVTFSLIGRFVSAFSVLAGNICFAADETDPEFADALKEMLKYPGGICAGYSKPLFATAMKYGIEKPLIVNDVSLAAYLINPNSTDYSPTMLASAEGITAPAVIFADDKPVSEELKKMISDCAVMPLISKRLNAKLESSGQTELLVGTEIPLALVLADMERSGMMIDTAGIAAFSNRLASEKYRTEQKIYSQAGEEFNINSPKQLGVILFEKLALPGAKKTKTGYSTNAEVLDELSSDYPVVADILRYRALAKLKSTYCDGLLTAVSNDGRVRSVFNQTETRTGRLSSSEPNLQNIPVRTQLGREMRRFFAAEEGNVLVDADYSQIELRVLAAVSGDKNMLSAFESGEDIHTVTASKVFGVDEAEVTSAMRSRAKAVNFGIVYGIGAFSLAKDIGSTRAEADAFIKTYLSLYSSVGKYLNESVEEARRTGYARSVFGRRRYLPELTSSNHAVRAFGERVAKNMPIQGAAADIIKFAMIKVHNALSEEIPTAKLIMQVHDELIVECRESDADRVKDILIREMENAVDIGVSLKVDAHVGRTWYDAKG